MSKLTVFVTGVAGFIGYNCARALLERGDTVVGADNLNNYYDVALKKARLAQLSGQDRFRFLKLDVTVPGACATVLKENSHVDHVLHLAAQAGVRHSIDHPEIYIQSNVAGHLQVLEACRNASQIRHMVYASSSSVYGGNETLPFSIEDRVDQPVSLYAASKRSAELISYSYSHLYEVPQTGLRFFTVYGPWGRPDMSAYIFTRAILEGTPIAVFNKGRMRRDFTYIDDIVAGILASLDRPPKRNGKAPPHRLYNLGNHKSEPLMRFIEVLEHECNKKAVIEFADMQPGDVEATFADIEASRRELGFEPSTTIDEGLAKFVSWFRDYHNT